jgi:endonuclease YncB( thermonuclease family)
MKKWILICISVIILALTGCSESNVVDKANETRDMFSNRVNANREKNKESEKEIVVNKGHWYTWNIAKELKEFQAPDGTTLTEGKVISVIDGDTVDVQITNGKTERVRLLLINTPKINSNGQVQKNPEPYAVEAQKFTKDLIEDRTVWLEIGEKERDQYGSLLAYIWLDQVVMNQEVLTDNKEVVIVGKRIGKITLNELLLKDGLAKVAINPPNTKYQDKFQDAEKNAKKELVGMWK